MKGEDIVLRNSSSTKTKQETFLACLAFSHGLARSSQLAVLENHLEKYIDSIKNIPLYMISKGKFPNLSRAAVTKKHGHLLHIRGLLNLHTDLVDALPDYYWSRTNSAQHFQSISRALDVVPRIRVLNQRLDYAAQLVSLMKDRQSELHGSKMEYIIIGKLIVH